MYEEENMNQSTEVNVMKDMIAYCGLDCETCDAYRAAINDDQALRERTAKKWAELNNAPICLNILIAKGAVRME